MASYKGRICIKQFIKDKPKNFGIKFFAIFSNDKGYIYELVPYSGKRISYEKYLGLGGSIVKNLIKNIKNKNNVLCFDNFYYNLSLFNYLSRSNFGFFCTFQKNRIGFPNKKML